MRAVLPALSLLLVVVALAATTRVRLADLLPDLAAIAEVEPLTGAVSSLGVLLWAAAAGVALAGATSAGVEPARRRALCEFGLLTALLTTDDQFLLHEDLLPRLGVPQPLVILALGAVSAGVLLRARGVLLARPDAVVLGLALALLTGAAAVDLAQEHLPVAWSAERLLLEDGLKLCGICVWLRYAVLLARS